MNHRRAAAIALLIGLTACQHEPGEMSEMGTMGTMGTMGEPGAQGPAGEPGVQGPAGEPGAQGPAGEPGAQGPAGPTGPQGEAGVAGPEGPEGATGPTGPVGATGTQGVTGPIGPAGPIGPTGPRGLPGAPGTPGEAGPTWGAGRVLALRGGLQAATRGAPIGLSAGADPSPENLLAMLSPPYTMHDFTIHARLTTTTVGQRIVYIIAQGNPAAIVSCAIAPGQTECSGTDLGRTIPPLTPFFMVVDNRTAAEAASDLMFSWTAQVD